jgi:adenine-specific DNA methylase
VAFEQLTVGLDVASTRSTNFRPLLYLGNKWRVLDLISTCIDNLASRQGPVADLFAGSGVVAAHLGRTRPIYAADVQEYARTLTVALLGGRDENDALSRIESSAQLRIRALTSVELEELLTFEAQCLDSSSEAALRKYAAFADLGPPTTLLETSEASRESKLVAAAVASLPSIPDTAISRYYGGVYFSFQQALVLDGLASIARRIPGRARDVAVAAVISTASELVGSVGGHFAQPIKLRDRNGDLKVRAVANLIAARRRDPFGTFSRWLGRYQAIPAPVFNHVVERRDFREALLRIPETTELIYADPPYTRDHYSRFYHVLETIAIGDDPGLSAVNKRGRAVPSRGAYRRERHQSPFSIKSQVVSAFGTLFDGGAKRGLPMVVSYSPLTVGTAARPKARLLSLDELVTLARTAYRKVELVEAAHVAHSKFNARTLNAPIEYGAEVLILCSRPR